ncbi:MAG: hypothetical protein ACE5GT_01565 [Rhodospirillales bacterium]
MVFPNTHPISRRLGFLAALVAVGVVAGVLYITDARSCATNAAAMEVMEQVFDFHIKDGMVARDIRTVRAWVGDTVRLRWTTDKPVVLHLHGYDIETKVAPGAVAEIVFKAHATGRFPVEVHGKGGAHGSGHRHDPLVIVEIYPR